MSGGTVKAKCVWCLYTKQCHKVSARLYPPHGGHLCEDCLVEAALHAQKQRDETPPPPPKPKEPSITCPECRMTSYNPNDIKQGYCGNCHWWTSDPVMRNVPKSERGVDV